MVELAEKVGADSKIPYERPLLLSEKGVDMFKGAVTKAKLFYDSIIESENYQFALLSNSRMDESISMYVTQDYALLYTSEITGTVKLVRLDYEYIQYRRSKLRIDMDSQELFYKDGYLLVKGEGDELGLIAHNGKVIIPLEYEMIEAVLDCMLLAADSNAEMTLFNYNGEIIREFKLWAKADLVFQLCGDPAQLLIREKRATKIKKDRAEYEVMVVWRGNLYSFAEYQVTDFYIHPASQGTFMGEKILFRVYTGSQVNFEYTESLILKKMKRIQF